MVKYTQTPLQQEDLEGLTKCVQCGKMAFNGAYCMYCGYPGKVSRRGRKHVAMAEETVERS